MADSRNQGDQSMRTRSSFHISILSSCILIACAVAQAQDPLPSWNTGPAKQAILNFVKVTTDPASPDFVPPGLRIATFDQDGTTWVEHPIDRKSTRLNSSHLV